MGFKMGIKQSKRSVDITSTPKKDGVPAVKDEKIVAEVIDEKPTANGDAKVENGEVKTSETNGDVQKEDLKDESVIKEEVTEDDTEKEKGEGDSKETEEGADKVEEKKKESKTTNLRKKLSFKKSFGFLRKKAAKEAKKDEEEKKEGDAEKTGLSNVSSVNRTLLVLGLGSRA